MRLHYLLPVLCLAYAGYAGADVYKRVDADGNVTYSNKPIKGGKRVELAPLPTVKSYGAGGTGYERVARTTQRERDGQRRKVLEDELAAEEKLLAEARQNLQDAQNNSQMSQAGGQTPGNADRQQEGIKNAQDQVSLHERNVQAIKQELSSIK